MNITINIYESSPCGGRSRPTPAPGPHPRPADPVDPVGMDPDACCRLLQQILTILFGLFAPTVDPNSDCCARIGGLINIFNTPLGPITIGANNLADATTNATDGQKFALASYLADYGISPDYQTP